MRPATRERVPQVCGELVANRDKRAMIFPMKRLADLGFDLIATRGTADVLRRNGIHASVVRKRS